MLSLRRGIVTEITGDGTLQRLIVELEVGTRPTVADTQLVGRCEAGDEVVVNVAALDLGLGSGGFDVVHVNLTRGLSGEGTADAHVMKLNYTSLQHAVLPVEDTGDLKLPLEGSAGVFFLHGQLAPIAWAIGEQNPLLEVGYIQTGGGALPGALSDVVRELLERDLLCDHITASPAYGGRKEAITTAGALHYGLAELGWDVALCGPGPGILGSASALGHGGLAALDSAHLSLALGANTVIVPRMSSGDERKRHRGLSHHTEAVLNLLLRPVTTAFPSGVDIPSFETDHTVAITDVDLAGYVASGLPTNTMGRSLGEDELFFAAALAGGTVLAERTIVP